MKLKKIKLINWHMFENETINVEGNILVTGENGCGKSTLIDALYYVLSGGDDKTFNNAANKNAKRSIESYVRGRLGNESKEYLREEGVIGHIALEYYDEKSKTSRVLGCVIDVNNTNKPKTKFYLIEKYSIQDSDYIENKKVLNFVEFKRKLRAKDIDFNEKQLNEVGRDKRCEYIGRDVFKLENKGKYAELLKRAIAFRPIDEVSTFVDNFLLKEDNINIEALMTEMRGYRDIKNRLDKENEKIELLESFIKKAEQYLENSKSIGFLEALKIYAEINENKKQIEKLEKDLRRINIEIEENGKRSENIEKDIKECDKKLIQLESNDAYKALQSLKTQLDYLNKKKTEEDKKLKDIEYALKNEQRIANYFKLRYRFSEDIRTNNFPLFKEHVISYSNDIEDISEQNGNNIFKLNNDIENLKITLKEHQLELDNIKKGKNTYNENTTKLLKLLKEELKKKYNKEIEVRPLCEYLEIKDNHWTNAIEGYLNTQRFDIIISPKYYDEAVEIYEKHKKQLNIHSVGIIHSKENFDETYEKNSLYEKLEIENKYAKFAALMILGKVICVKEVGDLKNHKIAITPSCMTYKNYTARNINPLIYKVPYIGKDSILKRMELLESKIKEEEGKINELKAERDNLIKENNLIKSSNVQILKDTDNVWNNIETLNNKIDEQINEIQRLEKGDELFAISEEIKRIKKISKKLNEDKYILNKDREEKIRKSATIDSNIKSTLSNINASEEQYKSEVSKFKEYEYDEFKKPYLDKGSNIDEIQKELFSLRNSNSRNQDAILQGMQNYSSKYDMDLIPHIENIEDFIRTYNQLKERDIIKYRDQADNAYERCQNSFKLDFISKLKEKIDLAKDEINKINKKLRSTPFGTEEEIFQFEATASSVDEMREYYNIITSGKVMEVESLLDSELDPREQDIMKNLFDKIVLADSNLEAEKGIQKYLDYRQYMKYDIKTTNKHGDVSYFSKTNSEKSGGETQTPFYVIIASCFDRLIKKEKDNLSTCTVILDEAFNNMDESRIRSLMEFYKGLNIQLIVVVPSNRMATLASYMDKVIGLVKQKNHIFVRELGNEHD